MNKKSNVNYNLPSYDKIKKLYEKYSVPFNIQRHMHQVARIAKYISKKLNSHGEKIDAELMEKAGLLHDIAKYISLKEDKKHCKKGYEILMEEGYPEMAEFALTHTGYILHEEDGYAKWHAQKLEIKILMMADAYVLHDEIVFLDDRMAYLYNHYKIEHISMMEKVWREFEQELKERCGFDIAQAINDLGSLKETWIN